ncbi:MAG: hypothetical protein R3C39_15810 [Dehalococcoidia bacterium]
MSDATSAPTAPRLEEQLAEALERLEGLTGRLERTQSEVAEWQARVADLTDALRTVDGRTQRQDDVRDAVADLRREVADLAGQFEQEWSLRREVASGLERGLGAERAQREGVAISLESLLSRVDAVEQRLVADLEARRSLVEGIGLREHDEADLATRLEALELRAAADREAVHALAQDASTLAAALPEVNSALRQIDSRTRETQLDQRRTGDSISALQADRDREGELLELVERQRATRLSLEERVTRFDEELEAVRQRVAAAAEERALIRQQLAGLNQRIEALRESVEAQRQTVVEHFGLVTRAEEESKRRQVEEIERSLRRARDLLVRLDERSEAVSREQPL